ncbi:sulfite exporter TauE/SafE family protein [Bergeyella zoohelcum]|uniref:sulfite exporter TauE/SafE family protein n=1 Tax=Bergeyella zoohelcum TaxID=1015 RepID=UPI002A91FA09|nr:sulfite exporter TauE/SafE family protein [Bergeyella zoohelcum]MDY6026264.1 sulfite exporter TauE/SafE family protein [Bergeyella zoohelcum]
MEIAMVISALGLGFATGFHCVGMCGPIALSMGMTKTQALKFQLHNLSYNFGRISMYALLGAVLGLVGQGFEMAGVQQPLSIGVGIIMMLMAAFSFGGKDFATKIPFINGLLYTVKKNLGKFLQRQNLSGRFITGLLNGLLPCGMVYVALTASLAAGGVWQGVAYMALFGMGTFPFMFAVVLFGGFITQKLRNSVLKLVPMLMFVMGVLFVLRGLDLGIPYLSPPKESLELKTDKKMHHSSGHSCH